LHLFKQGLKKIKHMKTIYRPFIKGTNWALAGIVVLLGFAGATSCSDSIAEYGSPHADFTVKGNVTNQDGAPIPGIQVSVGSSEYHYSADTTDSNGHYAVLPGYANNNLLVFVDDIDGEENGSYSSDYFPLGEVSLTGGDKHWYQGKGEKTLDIKLKENPKAETNE
jgi:putative lipoprotein (rSAM/lipoprotein system)